MAETYRGASVFATDYNYEVQRTNHFEVSFNNVPGAENIRMCVETVKIPGLQLNPLELKKGNQTVYAASGPKYNGGSLSVKDAIGQDLEKVLYDWFCQVYNPETGLLGRVADYKKTLSLFEYSPDGQTCREFVLEGCFPTSLDFGQLTYASPDKKMVSMNIICDKAYPRR